jgi:Family of unknown function (DUF5403)
MVYIERGTVGRFRNLEECIAHVGTVQHELDSKADTIARRARSILELHRDTGNARIEVVKGDIDAYVVLVDEAALSIEFGRAAHIGPAGHLVGGMDGLHILASATNLSRRGR